MAMGYSGSSAIVIGDLELKEMGITSHRLLTEMIEKLADDLSDYDIFDVLEINGPGYYDHVDKADMEKLISIYDSFTEEFEALTGIGVCLGYHDSESDGGRYDEVDGLFYELNFDDIYEMKPAAKKLRGKIDFNDKYFVLYG